MIDMDIRPLAIAQTMSVIEALKELLQRSRITPVGYLKTLGWPAGAIDRLEVDRPGS